MEQKQKVRFQDSDLYKRIIYSGLAKFLIAFVFWVGIFFLTIWMIISDTLIITRGLIVEIFKWIFRKIKNFHTNCGNSDNKGV